MRLPQITDLPQIQLPLIVPIAPEGTPIHLLPFQPNPTFAPLEPPPNNIQERVHMVPMTQHPYQQHVAQYGGVIQVPGQLGPTFPPSIHHLRAHHVIGINPYSSPTVRFHPQPPNLQPCMRAMSTNFRTNNFNHQPRPVNPTMMPSPAEQKGAHPRIQRKLPATDFQHGKSKPKPFYSPTKQHQRPRKPKRKDHP